MNALPRVTRRNVVAVIAGSASSLLFPHVVRAQSVARIVVIGGGFAGACCARALKRIDPKLDVTLVEQNRTFTACPFSNEVIAGMREIEVQQFGYDGIAAAGIRIVIQAATEVNTTTRTITLADGGALKYDRLVLAPGIDLRFDALAGYDEAASARMPHAWIAGEQTMLLRRQLEAMEDGGLVAIAVPASPSRCPPAPYERASLIAHYLKTRKPRSKVLVLDAKDTIPQQRLFENAWKELYPGIIERVSLSQGGRVTSVDPVTTTIVTEFGNYKCQVANVIPPQKAGRIAEIAGAVDNTGWCPIDPLTFASRLAPNVHVIGDACLGGGIPKSASAANAQAKACAAAIANLISGQPPAKSRLTGICYNTVAPGYAFSFAGSYERRDDLFAEIIEDGGTSPVNAPREVRMREAEMAQNWYKTITVDTFG
jgi:NADPH-dependent 2,4-dienoyl-CoA reductase/sulfur reductase-like enzyme